jgi:hypothetical protein
MVLHEAEVEFGELLHLLVDMTANIARTPKRLSQNWVDFNLNVSLSEDFTASL